MVVLLSPFIWCAHSFENRFVLSQRVDGPIIEGADGSWLMRSVKGLSSGCSSQWASSDKHDVFACVGRLGPCSCLVWSSITTAYREHAPDMQDVVTLDEAEV